MRSLWYLGALILASLVNAQSLPRIDFQKQVAPIFLQSCLSCHATARANSSFAITRQSLLSSKIIVPGKPEDSAFYKVLLLPTGNPRRMPPGGPGLSEEKIGIIKRWIEEGATWPDGVSLTVASAHNDERQVVQEIHQRVLAHAPAKMEPYKVTIPNTTVSYEMVPIPGGEFLMGSRDSGDKRKDEQPQHKVRVDAFWMQAHEVTWDEYRLFMFANQAGEIAHKDDLVDGVSRPTRPYVEMSFGMGISGFPAISMTQHAANKYAEWLSAKTGEFYRLPTEAEWEYACRAGSSTPYFFGADESRLGDYAWYSANSGGKYRKVASKKPNPWGLFDMLGNVMEWTLDQYQPYQAGEAVNPWVKATAPYPQSVRGGSWNDPADSCTCSVRVASDPSWKQQDPQLPKSIWYETDAQWLGFRLVQPTKPPDADQMYKYWNSGVEHDEQ